MEYSCEHQGLILKLNSFLKAKNFLFSIEVFAIDNFVSRTSLLFSFCINIMKAVSITKMNYPHGMIPFAPLESRSVLPDAPKVGNIRRGPWSPEEDRRLMEIILLYGPLNWVKISVLLVSRSPKQCRERYHQNLKPLLNRNPINTEEGMLIEKLVLQYGKKWAEIARHLPGRSDNAIKNWWNGGANRRRRALQILCPEALGSISNPVACNRHASVSAIPTDRMNTVPSKPRLNSYAPSSSGASRQQSNVTPSSLAPPHGVDNSWRRRLTGFDMQLNSSGRPELLSMSSLPAYRETGPLVTPPIAYHNNPNIAFNTSMFSSPLAPFGSQNVPQMKHDAGLADAQRLNYRYVSVPQPQMPHFMLQSPPEVPTSSLSSHSSHSLLYNASRNGSIGCEVGPVYAPYMPQYPGLGQTSAMSTVLSTLNLRRPLVLPTAPNSATNQGTAGYPLSTSGLESEITKSYSHLRTGLSSNQTNNLNSSNTDTESESIVAPNSAISKLGTAGNDETEESTPDVEDKKMCVSNLIN